MTRNCNDSFNDILENFLSNILVEKPCRITKVYSQTMVDVEYYDNNQKDTLCRVPVKHLQTQQAFIYLGLKVGDCGTVRFFDNKVSDYYNGTSDKLYPESRKHNINDNLFSLGFYPAPEQYVFPEGDVVIGTSSGAIINITEDTISIVGGDISVNGGSVSISGDTVIEGKTFLEHTHSNGNNGNPTGGVL